MKVLFVGGTYIKPKNEAEMPEWNDRIKLYFIGGYRWIKSKRKWSSSCLLHNFRNEPVWIDESEIDKA